MRCTQLPCPATLRVPVGALSIVVPKDSCYARLLERVRDPLGVEAHETDDARPQTLTLRYLAIASSVRACKHGKHFRFNAGEYPQPVGLSTTWPHSKDSRMKNTQLSIRSDLFTMTNSWPTTALRDARARFTLMTADPSSACRSSARARCPRWRQAAQSEPRTHVRCGEPAGMDA